MWLWRALTLIPAVLTTLAIMVTFAGWFVTDGINALEIILLVFIPMTFFWISLSVSTATVGLIKLVTARFGTKDRKLATSKPVPLNTALLIPIYNEAPAEVFGNALAMLQQLEQSNTNHRFSLFILSDTRDEKIAEMEQRAFEEIRYAMPPNPAIYYRRRPDNVDRKTGNIADWIERWGGAYEAMLVLDADSLMCGSAITRLCDELSVDPSAGLIQSFPQIIGANSVFGRAQQFASTVYGNPLAHGLATWADREGNFWGHNAIIRTQAFASCAGLPKLRSRKSNDVLILSHDFVEAGLMRRAGWAVRFLPEIKGSFEETPPTLIDYVLRDRRWCQGNLQHLGLLGTRGFHPVSRFHLFHGAISYLLSPAWFVLLAVWALYGNGEEASVLSYFSEANPMFPVWPEINMFNGFWVMMFMYAMILTPKLIGALSVHFAGIRIAELGGLRRFGVSLFAEILIAIAYAPIMMIQQVIAISRSVVGIREKWTPQQRSGGSYPLAVLLKFHAVETAIGTLLTAGLVFGVVSFWTIPIAFSLLLAVPLSALSGLSLNRWQATKRLLNTPEMFEKPEIIRIADENKAFLSAVLQSDRRIQIAAE